MKRTIFYISDGTGITAEKLGHSLISQFAGIEFNQITIPYVDTNEKAEYAVQEINKIYTTEQSPPIVIATLINEHIRNIILNSKGNCFEVFSTFLPQLSQVLCSKSSPTIGKTHSVQNTKIYQSRIDAINFALQADDGLSTTNYENSDLILIGPSRSGKTPTCLYLAIQFGVNAANYPIVPEDLEKIELPRKLTPYRNKLVGLIIEPEKLQTIRKERLKNNPKYYSLESCKWEIDTISNLYRHYGIPYFNTTNYSIEEISTKILALKGIKRKNF
jgi:regulator of PEP synthase PpsR (kinase-PPPase family)